MLETPCLGQRGQGARHAGQSHELFLAEGFGVVGSVHWRWLARRMNRKGYTVQESEAEDLGWEETETGCRAVYITHGSARQSWTTTYPSVKKRVVSQNLRSVGQSRREYQKSKNQINIIPALGNDSMFTVDAYDIRNTLAFRDQYGMVMRRLILWS